MDENCGIKAYVWVFNAYMSTLYIRLAYVRARYYNIINDLYVFKGHSKLKAIYIIYLPFSLIFYS